MGQNPSQSSAGPFVFQASKLVASALSANLVIETHDKAQIEFTVTGPQPRMTAFSGSVRRGVLTIEDNGDGMRSATIHLGGVSASNISAESVFEVTRIVRRGKRTRSQTTIVKGQELPTVTVRVPVGTDIEVSEISGFVTIGDTGGDLTLDHGSTKPASIGAVSTLSLHHSGTDPVTVASCDGPADLDCSGTGRLTVGPVGGSVTATHRGTAAFSVESTGGKTYLECVGVGALTVGNINGSANVTHDGPGPLTVESCVSSLEINHSSTSPTTVKAFNGTKVTIDNNGVGQVTISSGSIGTLEADNNGVGGITIGAEVVDASLTNSGVGSITATSVTGSLVRNNSGVGRIVVKNRP